MVVYKDGGYSGKVTPVPIPNTEVKLTHADGTVPATEWQSRSPPSLYTITLSLYGITFIKIQSFLLTANDSW